MVMNLQFLIPTVPVLAFISLTPARSIQIVNVNSSLELIVPHVEGYPCCRLSLKLVEQETQPEVEEPDIQNTEN